MSGITWTHDFARKIVASAQRTKEKSGERFRQTPHANRGFDAQARRFQTPHRSRHGDHIAIIEGFQIQQSRIPPDRCKRLCHRCEQGIVVTPDHHVHEDDSASPQPGFRQSVKVWCQEVARYPAFDEGVEHDGIVAFKVPAKEPAAISQMTFHRRRHVKIAPRDGEGARVHIQQCDIYSLARQHGS